MIKFLIVAIVCVTVLCETDKRHISVEAKAQKNTAAKAVRTAVDPTTYSILIVCKVSSGVYLANNEGRRKWRTAVKTLLELEYDQINVVSVIGNEVNWRIVGSDEALEKENYFFTRPVSDLTNALNGVGAALTVSQCMQALVELYEPVGILDPPLLDEQQWLDFQPKTVAVSPNFRLSFKGLIADNHGGFGEIYAKIPNQRGINCNGYHDTANPRDALLDADLTAELGVDFEGIYFVCIKHRQDWQLIRTPLHAVKEWTELFHGHSSCSGLIASTHSDSEALDVCGCYTNLDGVRGSVPASLPASVVKKSQIPLDMGCCEMRTPCRQDVTTAWGVCSLRACED